MKMKVNLKSSLKKGISYLLTQNSVGYPEAVHYVTLPRITSQGILLQMHPTIFFQRMMILDSLLDCFDTDNRITKELIKEEIELIIKSKHPHLKGGWSYIPDFFDLPPDADDLAMVVQLLSRTGGIELSSICDEALDILFKYNKCQDGSFDLWVIDKSDTPQHSREVDRYIKVTKGGGSSPEVVGNLIYALTLYNIDKFKSQIESGIGYLELCQDEKGFWSSKWYWGNFYSTFRVVAALRAIDQNSKSILKAEHYLVKSQNSDGGWGEETSNPLDTALALLSLVESSDAHDAQQKGLSYLIRMQSGDGSWNRSPFIKVVSPDGPSIYGSKTITTSLCIKALAKAISYNPHLKFIIAEMEDLPYERKIIDLKINTNNNWSWILSKNNELIQRNSSIRDPSYLSSGSFLNRFPILHIIELTKECNQACTYCSVSAIHSSNPLTSIADNHFGILDKIVEFILASSDNSFCVEYQGGEALLNTQALKYLTREISKKARELNKMPTFRLVSNLTLLDSNMIDFIISNRIQVSTSLDGIERLHNRYRKLPGSNESYKKVLDNINRLRKVGVNVGVMAVITADSLTEPEAIVDNFANLGMYPFVINPVFSSGRATNSWNILGIDPDVYSQFWKRLVRHCLEYQSQNIPIWDLSFELLLRKVILAQEPEYLDLKSPCGCIHGQIAYDLQGNIYPCDEARRDQKVILGNVMKSSFKCISECKEALEIIDASIINSERCELCAYRPWCGRCPLGNKILFGKYDVPSEITYSCRIWKGLFDKFFELMFEDMDKITMAASLVTRYDITRKS